MNTKNMEQTANDNLQMALNKFTEAQEKHGKSVEELVAAVTELTGNVRGFKDTLDTRNNITAKADIRPLEQIVEKGLTDIKLLAGNKPQPITRKFQLLLFPEQDAKLFYKIVFGRWFLWLVIMLAMTNLYKLMVHWMDNRQQLQEKQAQQQVDLVIKAWHYLYDSGGKEFKRKMDSAIIKGNAIRQFTGTEQ